MKVPVIVLGVSVFGKIKYWQNLPLPWFADHIKILKLITFCSVSPVVWYWNDILFSCIAKSHEIACSSCFIQKDMDLPSFLPTKDVGSWSSGCNESIQVMATAMQACQHNWLAIQMRMIQFTRVPTTMQCMQLYSVSMRMIWGIAIEKNRMRFKCIPSLGSNLPKSAHCQARSSCKQAFVQPIQARKIGSLIEPRAEEKKTMY